MASAARILAKRFLTAGDVRHDALRAAVDDLCTARADAINQDGLEAQCACLLEAYGPDELFERFAAETEKLADAT